MTDQIITFSIYSLILFGGMLFGEFLYRVVKLNTEWTRKVIHVSSGIVSLSYPFFINTHWIVLAITINFTIILYTSKKMGWFQSIFSVGRKSYGELFFVWSTWFLFVLYQYTGDVNFYYLSFAPVVFADPAAALIGKSFPFKKYTVFGNTKSYGGSFSFFIITFALTFFFVTSDISNIAINTIPSSLHSNLHLLTSTQAIPLSIGLALLLTLTEAISSKGLDNLTIPIASVVFILVNSFL